MRERGDARRNRLSLLAFPALAVALFPRAAVGAATFFHYDTWMQNLAFRAWWFRELRGGHFATWCPGLFAGYPLFAETQTGPLYPPTFLLFSLLPATLAFSWSVVLHFAFAGAGAFLLARRLGTSLAASLLAGVAFELSGFLVTHVVHFNLLVGATWAPWVALLSLRTADGRPRDAVLLALAFAALLLGAHPYAVLMNGLLAAIVLLFRAGLAARRAAVALAALAGVVAVAVALAAVQVLPARELVSRTPRGDAVDWSFLTFGSFAPWNAATLVAPDLFGTPVNGTFWGGPDWSHFAETCAYPGIVALALAVGAIVLRRDVATALFASIASLSFVLMLGRYTPLYHLLGWIPVVRSTRLPARFALLFTLSVAVLAALGLDALARESDARRRRTALAVALGVVLLLAVCAFVLAAPARSPDELLAGTGRMWTAHLSEITAAARATAARTGVVFLAAIAALVPFLLARVPSRAAMVPVLVLALDLFSWGRDFNPVLATEKLLQPPPAVAALPEVAPRARIFRQGLDEMWDRVPGMPRVDLVTPAWKGNESSYATATWALSPNSQLLYGVDSGEGFTSLPPLAWLEWMGLPTGTGAAPRPDLSEAQADLLSIDAVLSSGGGIVGEGWKVEGLPGDLFLSRNADPLPRARLARSWATTPRGELLTTIRARDYDPRRRVLLEQAPPGLPASQDDGPVAEPVAAREIAPGHWRVDVPRASGGIVVLSESYDPGWIATRSDGTRLPILRADGLFVAFPAPTDGGIVDISYSPSSVRFGAMISVLAGVIVLVVGWLLRSHRWASLPSESRQGLRFAPIVAPLAAITLTGVSMTLDVGDVRADRARVTLDASAARSWSAEAQAALRAGVPEESVRLLRIATARIPSDPVLHYRLGLAEQAAGRTEAARAEFHISLSLAPNFAPAGAALRDIERNGS